MTRDPQGEAERLPAHLDGDELSPEVALVDPDVAERARDALPDITLTEIRLSLSIKVEQAPAPPVPQSPPEPVAVAEPAPAPALVRPADAPAPPAYDDVRRVFREPRLGPRRRRHAGLAALVILGVAAGVALALPRAVDGPSSPTPESPKRSSGAPARASSAGSASDHVKVKAKAKGTSAAKAKADKRAAPQSTRHLRAPQKAKPKKHAVSPPAPTRHVPKHKAKAPPVRPRTRVIPDFVWAPVKNASGYLVEFRAASRVVLRVRTRVARLHVAARQLQRGRYRWLVWRVGKSGSPIGKPLVDSSVRVR